jgi:hypothetical protein
MALTDMRLRAFSGLLVASVLAGCATTGSDGGPPPTDVLAEPVATPSVSNYRWVEVAEVLRRTCRSTASAASADRREEPFVAVWPTHREGTQEDCLASAGEPKRAASSSEPAKASACAHRRSGSLCCARSFSLPPPDDPDLYRADQPPDNGGFWREEDAAGKSNLDPQRHSPFSAPPFIKVTRTSIGPRCRRWFTSRRLAATRSPTVSEPPVGAPDRALPAACDGSRS